MIYCSRCKKRPAVVFISTMNGTEKHDEGLCLVCAKELGVPQVSEYLEKMGISDEDFEQDFEQAYDSFFGAEGLPDASEENSDKDEEDDE